MALRHRGSDHNVSQPVDIFSKAAFRSATRRSSAAKSKQEPTSGNVSKSSSLQAGKEEVERKPTSQQFASRLDNTKDEGLALFTMDNRSHQTGYLFFKGGDLLHVATGLASLFDSLLRLAFGQR
jgi:hypothetical protein